MRLTRASGLGPGIGSNTTGRIPANPSSQASINPSGPAPTMTTSVIRPAQLPSGSGDHRNPTHQCYLRVYLPSDSLRNVRGFSGGSLRQGAWSVLPTAG